jgi:hypothetical protein
MLVVLRQSNTLCEISCVERTLLRKKKGKKNLPTFQLITLGPIKGYNPNILNEEPYLVMFMGTKLLILGYNGCMQAEKLNSIRNDLH